MRRGHVAPQNTFLDTIIRKFEGQSEWGRGQNGEGVWGRVEFFRVWMEGRARAVCSTKCESVGAGGPQAPGRGRGGKAWCRGS